MATLVTDSQILAFENEYTLGSVWQSATDAEQISAANTTEGIWRGLEWIVNPFDSADTFIEIRYHYAASCRFVVENDGSLSAVNTNIRDLLRRYIHTEPGQGTAKARPLGTPAPTARSAPAAPAPSTSTPGATGLPSFAHYIGAWASLTAGERADIQIGDMVLRDGRFWIAHLRDTARATEPGTGTVDGWHPISSAFRGNVTATTPPRHYDFEDIVNVADGVGNNPRAEGTWMCLIEGSYTLATITDFDSVNWVHFDNADQLITRFQEILTQFATDGDFRFSHLTGQIAGSQIPDDLIIRRMINDAAVGEAELGTGSVTSVKISANAITAEKVADAAITGPKLAVNSVSADKIASDAVSGAKLDTGAVSSTKIGMHAVLADKLANNAVETRAVKDGAITESKLAAAVISQLGGSSSSSSGGAFDATQVTTGDVEVATASTWAASADMAAALRNFIIPASGWALLKLGEGGASGNLYTHGEYHTFNWSDLRAINASTHGTLIDFSASAQELAFTNAIQGTTLYLGRTSDNKLLVSTSNATRDPHPLTLYTVSSSGGGSTTTTPTTSAPAIVTSATLPAPDAATGTQFYGAPVDAGHAEQIYYARGVSDRTQVHMTTDYLSDARGKFAKYGYAASATTGLVAGGSINPPTSRITRLWIEHTGLNEQNNYHIVCHTTGALATASSLDLRFDGAAAVRLFRVAGSPNDAPVYSTGSTNVSRPFNAGSTVLIQGRFFQGQVDVNLSAADYYTRIATDEDLAALGGKVALEHSAIRAYTDSRIQATVPVFVEVTNEAAATAKPDDDGVFYYWS